MPTPRFSVTYDALTLGLSIFLFVAIAGIGLFVHNMVLPAVALLIVGLGYAWSPRGYTVGGRRIVVHRSIGDVVIPLEALAEARRATRDDLCGAIRLWGSGGLFGYYGKFRLPRYGVSTWYVTHRKRMVIVATGRTVVVVSPDDIDGFLEAVRAEAPVTTAPPAVGSFAKPRWMRLIPWIAAAFGVATVTFVIVALNYNPGMPRYALNGTTLKIEDRFYPVTIRAENVDPRGIRVVDLRDERDWRPVRRTNGFANAHYSSGWYRTAGEQRIRLYSAHGNKLVLIPDREAPVLIETQSPEEFATRLRGKWMR